LSDKLEQRLKAKKARTLKKRVTILITLIAAIAVIVVLLQMVNSLDRRAPTYSEFSTTSTRTGASLTFRALWNDNVNVSGYIFESNITGTFSNDTWVPFSTFVNSTSAYSTAAKTVNSTTGEVTQWRFWCNDSSNNWRSTSLLLDSNKVLLVTSMGNVTIELYDDMPITTGNFRNLVNRGIYDETIFHRIAKGFVVQGGDATPKGITVPSIQDELPNKHSNVRGSVAMAKTSEPNSASSQFFVNLNETNVDTLDSSYSVFGRVTAGMDIVDAISQVPINPGLSENDGKPVQDVTLTKAEIIG
jgi:peptidylprolyl isomerase